MKTMADDELENCVQDLLEAGEAEDYDDAVAQCQLALSDNSDKDYANDLERWRDQKNVWRAKQALARARRHRAAQQQQQNVRDSWADYVEARIAEHIEQAIATISQSLAEAAREKVERALKEQLRGELDELHARICGLTVEANIAAQERKRKHSARMTGTANAV